MKFRYDLQPGALSIHLREGQIYEILELVLELAEGAYIDIDVAVCRVSE